MRYFVSKADKPTSKLVFELIRFIFKLTVIFFGIVAPVVNDYFGNIRIRCFNINFNILIVMLETKLVRFAVTDIIPSENWFMYRSYLAIL